MPRIDQKLVNSPINTPSMAIDGAIDVIDAINANFFRRRGSHLEPFSELNLHRLVLQVKVLDCHATQSTKHRRSTYGALALPSTEASMYF